LLATIAKTIFGMKAFGMLFLIFVYLFVSIGKELFAYQVKIGEGGLPNNAAGYYADSNFNNFLEGFLACFIVMVNDGWSTIFFTHAKAADYPIKAYIYFILLLLLGQFFVFNLFVAILLRHFEADSVEK